MENTTRPMTQIVFLNAIKNINVEVIMQIRYTLYPKVNLINNKKQFFSFKFNFAINFKRSPRVKK